MFEGFWNVQVWSKTQPRRQKKVNQNALQIGHLGYLIFSICAPKAQSFYPSKMFINSGNSCPKTQDVCYKDTYKQHAYESQKRYLFSCAMMQKKQVMAMTSLFETQFSAFLIVTRTNQIFEIWDKAAKERHILVRTFWIWKHWSNLNWFDLTVIFPQNKFKR